MSKVDTGCQNVTLTGWKPGEFRVVGSEGDTHQPGEMSEVDPYATFRQAKGVNM